MTDISVQRPISEHQLRVSLEAGERKLYFEKECLEDVTIYRRVDDGNWDVLATHARAPVIDKEPFPQTAKLPYKAAFADMKESQPVEVSLA